MSMAKKASATAEAAADLDLVEGAIGTSATRPAMNNGQLLLGFALSIVALLAVVLAYQLVFGSVDLDHSALPDGYRESTGLAVDQDVDEGTAALIRAVAIVNADAAREPDATVDGRSTFASAKTQEPIILEVACPVGTVQISTGPEPVDTVCVQGQLVGSAPAEPTVQRVIIFGPNAPSIGGTLVPAGLHCQEDEAIAFVGIPDTLFCVHVDDVATAGQ